MEQQIVELRVALSKEQTLRQMSEDLKQWACEGKEPCASMFMQFVHFVIGSKD